MNSDITIIRRPVKHARLRVSEDGSVRLIAPADFEPERIADILKKKKDWIRRNQASFDNRSGAVVPSPGRNETLLHGEIVRVSRETARKAFVAYEDKTRTFRVGAPAHQSSELPESLRAYARYFLRERTLALSRNHRFSFNRLFVRSQRTKWGNCSRLKNISLNWKLVQLPVFVCDYVILHELLHTRIMNHSDRFWVAMRALYPRTDEAVRWLENNGAAWSV